MTDPRKFLLRFSPVPALILAAVLSGSCAGVARVGSAVAQSAGVISADQAASITRSAEAVEKSFEDISPEQEYYIGRAVGANLMAAYRPFDRDPATRYLNLLGRNLALYSDRPETFGGWHFLILDSDEINAFAAPGGLIFVSRGMISCAAGETALAAVLAHEISHVQLAHGLKAIRKDRLTSALAIIGTEAAKSLGGQELKDLTRMFEGSITDITRTMVNSGYSRNLEEDADAGAVALLRKAGYSPEGLVAMLEEMKKRLKPGGPDFAKTHPDPAYRIGLLRKRLGPGEPIRETPAMTTRYRDFLGALGSR